MQHGRVRDLYDPHPCQIPTFIPQSASPPHLGREKGYKCTSQLPAYLHRLGRAAGPVLRCGCGWEAAGGHWEHPRGRVMVVVVDHRWPGPVCFHGQGSSKLQVLVGERQRVAAETCASTEGSLAEGPGFHSVTPWERKTFGMCLEKSLQVPVQKVQKHLVTSDFT